MRKQMGEIIIDHRASPGLPEDIARYAGYDPALCKEGKIYEQHTLTCSHCKGVVVKNPFRTRERNYCIKCSGHYICDPCAFKATLPDYVHTPFDKVIEQHLTAENRVASRLITEAYRDGSPPQLLLPPGDE